MKTEILQKHAFAGHVRARRDAAGFRESAEGFREASLLPGDARVRGPQDALAHALEAVAFQFDTLAAAYLDVSAAYKRIAVEGIDSDPHDSRERGEKP